MGMGTLLLGEHIENNITVHNMEILKPVNHVKFVIFFKLVTFVNFWQCFPKGVFFHSFNLSCFLPFASDCRKESLSLPPPVVGDV